jgi:predicted DsbA family dithiol-disulfide isomerase
VLLLTHDYTSPASAIAVARFHRLAADGLQVRFRGVDVLGIDGTLPVTLDVLAELERVAPRAAALGLQMQRPDHRPSTARAHVVADLAEQQGVGTPWRRRLYAAYWTQGADLADPGLLAEVASEVGLDPDAALAAATDERAVAAVRRRTQQLRGEGIGGVPVLTVHGTHVSPALPDDDLWALGG